MRTGSFLIVLFALLASSHADASSIIHCFTQKDLVAAKPAVKAASVQKYFLENMRETEVAAVDLCTAGEKNAAKMLSLLKPGPALDVLRAAADKAGIPFAIFYQAAHAEFLNELYEQEETSLKSRGKMRSSRD